VSAARGYKLIATMPSSLDETHSSACIRSRDCVN
jgi:cysteine synthase